MYYIREDEEQRYGRNKSINHILKVENIGENLIKSLILLVLIN